MTHAVPVDLQFIRRGYEAWNERGVEGIAPFWSEDVELIDAAAIPGAAHKRGREAAAEHLRARVGEVGEIALEVNEIVPLGERDVLVGAQISIVGRRSGVPTTRRVWHLLTVGADGVERIAEFFERDAALAAAGR